MSMYSIEPSAKPLSLAILFSRRRVFFTLKAALVLGLLMSIPNQTATWIVLVRALVVGFGALFVFGVFERWPVQLPVRLARWVWQLMGVVLAVPIFALAAYWLTYWGNPQFGSQPVRIVGMLSLIFCGVLFAPWFALGAMVRQREAFARHQALAFELERSELERKALDARLRFLQAQVEPHFLFNTLANVRALVKAGSPQAPQVLDSLIAYLRAAVPRLHESATTLGQELTLVRAYLDLMQMRMPDRLHYSVVADAALYEWPCPPMTLMTLVENAVKHGIDPSEEGGRIDITAQQHAGRCQLIVRDTGIGMGASGQGLGTGLQALQERLALAFYGDAQLQLRAVEPHGVCAEIDLPSPSNGLPTKAMR